MHECAAFSHSSVQLTYVANGSKKRLCWTPELHALFKETVATLGTRQRRCSCSLCLHVPASSRPIMFTGTPPRACPPPPHRVAV